MNVSNSMLKNDGIQPSIYLSQQFSHLDPRSSNFVGFNLSGMRSGFVVSGTSQTPKHLLGEICKGRNV